MPQAPVSRQPLKWQAVRLPKWVGDEEKVSESLAGVQGKGRVGHGARGKGHCVSGAGVRGHANQIGAWELRLLEGVSSLFTPAAERKRDSEADAKEHELSVTK